MSTGQRARIERATTAAATAAGELLNAVLDADELPAADAVAVLEVLATLTATLQQCGPRALALLAPTHGALAEVRRLLLAEADLDRPAATGSGADRGGRARSRRPATGPDTAEGWAERGEMAIAERVWFYDRDTTEAGQAERAVFMALPIAAKREALHRRGTAPWPQILAELTARHA
ncbi:hypothetical protein ACI1MP_37150 (plasmid) [Kitasatospora griseola]|uniref:hypothetical protein n=1 Tax=Kitasatospora griseola TaxID=2064 RepID=UPI0038557336